MKTQVTATKITSYPLFNPSETQQKRMKQNMLMHRVTTLPSMNVLPLVATDQH
jgi:hypothetical protein